MCYAYIMRCLADVSLGGMARSYVDHIDGGCCGFSSSWYKVRGNLGLAQFLCYCLMSLYYFGNFSYVNFRNIICYLVSLAIIFQMFKFSFVMTMLIHFTEMLSWKKQIYLFRTHRYAREPSITTIIDVRTCVLYLKHWSLSLRNMCGGLPRLLDICKGLYFQLIDTYLKFGWKSGWLHLFLIEFSMICSNLWGKGKDQWNK